MRNKFVILITKYIFNINSTFEDDFISAGGGGGGGSTEPHEPPSESGPREIRTYFCFHGSL